MDLNDQNQYQNLSYTFQNLALSPPPPPAAEPPYTGLSDPYDTSPNPNFGTSPSGDYSGFIGKSSSSSSQKTGQADGPEGGGYAPSDDGVSLGGSMNKSGVTGSEIGSRTSGSEPRNGSGEGGMGSVGRGGWGSPNESVGSVNGNGHPGSIQSINKGRTGRSDLPSQWLDHPFHNPSSNGHSPVGFVSLQQQQQQQQQQQYSQLHSSSQHQTNGRPGQQQQQQQQQQQYQLGDNTSTRSTSPPLVHPSQISSHSVSPLLSSDYLNGHSQSMADSAYNSYGPSGLSSSPGTSGMSVGTGNSGSNGNYYSSSPTSITGFNDGHSSQIPSQTQQHQHQLPHHVQNHQHLPPLPLLPPHMNIGAHMGLNNSLHPSSPNSTGLAVGPGLRRYQFFGNGIANGPMGGSGTGSGPAGGQGWNGPSMVPGLVAGPSGPFSMGPAMGGVMDDDVIPTAIVIKNINFNLQKEDLLRTIESLGAPLPYAFNYHMDQGVFRGLAFANFRSAHEADAVVAALNGYDVGGRKLRVEYKKVLQAGEKERIEREKALRRMRSIQQPQGALPDSHQQQSQQQRPSTGSMSLVSTPVDEYPGIQPVSLGLGLGASPNPNSGHAQYPQHQQHQQQVGNQLLNRERSGSGEAQGMNGMGIPTVQVTSQRDFENGFISQQDRDDVGTGSDSGESGDSKNTELDLNDPITLDIYSRILVFKEDRMRDELAFSRTLSPLQRRVVHLVAQRLGVYHYSVGEGDKRYAVVTRSEGRVGGNGDRTLRHHASRPNLPTQQMNHVSHNHQSHQHHLQTNQNLYASSPSLRSKSSMPDLSHLHGPAVSRDPTRAIVPQRSNSNLRDGYSPMGSINGNIGGRNGVSSVHPRRSTTNPIDHGLLNPQMNIPSYHGSFLKQASESTESLLSVDGMTASLGQLGSSSSSLNGGGGSGGGMSQSVASLLRQPRVPGGGQNSGGFGMFRRFGMPSSGEKH